MNWDQIVYVTALEPEDSFHRHLRQLNGFAVCTLDDGYYSIGPIFATGREDPSSWFALWTPRRRTSEVIGEFRTSDAAKAACAEHREKKDQVITI